MKSINDLNQGTPTLASQFPMYDTGNGRDAKCSLNDIAEVVQAQLTQQGDFVTQYASPNATAFNIAIAPPEDGTSMWLVLTPTGTFGTGTITLPPVANCVHQQEVLVNCTQVVTALTIAGNGATVNGAPTTFAANGFMRLRFEGVQKAWYRVG